MFFLTAAMSQPAQHQQFSCEWRHALDEKMRVTIPALWRLASEGGETFFLKVDRGGACIRATPPEEFAAAVTRLENQGVGPKDVAEFRRMHYAKSRPVTTDKQGRIIIPADYAAAAGIKKEVMLVGAGTRFEIYNPDSWDRVQQAQVSNYDRLADLAGE